MIVKEEYRKRAGSYEGMISEDRSAPANLPQEVIHKMYASTMEDPNYEYPSTFEEFDERSKESSRKFREQMSKGKRY